MRNTFRFGRRLNIPSTVQIKHELRMMIAAENTASLQREASALQEIECKPQKTKSNIES